MRTKSTNRRGSQPSAFLLKLMCKDAAKIFAFRDRLQHYRVCKDKRCRQRMEQADRIAESLVK